jgi:cyanophycinase
VGHAAKEALTGRRVVHPGTLVAIGGNEDDRGACDVLGAVAAHARSGPLAVVTAASLQPERRWQSYERTFRRLGVRVLRHVRVDDREGARAGAKLLGDASAVFITGGDQFRLVERVGGTAVHEAIAAVLRAGGVVAGTSAGAAALGAVMIGGSADPTSELGPRTAPGLGLLPNAIVDQHCSQRGRRPRLAAAVARHPGVVGLGVDEDTAVVCDASGWLRVIGTGCVCVMDDHHAGAHGAVAADRLAVADGSRAPCHAAVAPLRVLTAGDRYTAARAWRAGAGGQDTYARSAIAS